MATRRNRKEQKEKREKKLEEYKSYIKSKVPNVDISGWLVLGSSYERALKLLAEREIYNEMKGGGKVGP